MISQGFFRLEHPFDLLRKLEHDLERLRSNPVDTYAAFDFFVTATHMHEWVKGVGWQSDHPPTEAHQAAVYKLCGDLGNGAKHFVLHKKFDNPAEVRDGWVQSGWVQAGAWIDVGDLMIRLNEPEATTLGAPSFTAVALAEMVLRFWREDLQRRGPDTSPVA